MKWPLRIGYTVAHKQHAPTLLLDYNFRAGTATKPNVYDTCAANFGDTDIFVAEVTWT